MLRTYVLVVVCISSEILLVNSAYLSSGTYCIYVSLDVWSGFFKPKGTQQKKCLGNNDLRDFPFILQLKYFIFPFSKLFCNMFVSDGPRLNYRLMHYIITERSL